MSPQCNHNPKDYDIVMVLVSMASPQLLSMQLHLIIDMVLSPDNQD